jgi:nucleotide-binding universal stress UspA family protein
MLVAVDLEPQSLAVLSRAIEIAAVSSCTLTVLHVVEVGRDASAEIDRSLDSRGAYQHLLERAREAVEQLVSECRRTEVQFNVVVEAGQGSTVILDVAERIRARLVVIGISNRRSLRERMIGSTADHVIRGSCASVLVIKGPAKTYYNRIIAAIDFSPQSEAVVNAASVLLPHARIRLVHVTDIPLQFQQALIETGTRKEEIARYRRARVEDSRKRLARLAEQVLGNVSYEVEIVEGEPATMLARLSRRRGVDVIAIGPHSRGVILQFFLGSVAQKLLREAACDLLISRAAGVARGDEA